MNKLKKYLILAAMMCLAAVLLSTAAYAENGPVYLVSNETYYDSLQKAFSYAIDNDVIEICGDVFISSRQNFIRNNISNITITDNGKPHNIYVYNTDDSKSGGYGRGIQVNNGLNLTISASDTGYLTIYGHDNENENNNSKEVINVYNGTLNLENIIIKECNNTAVFSYYTSNSVNVTNCSFVDNVKYDRAASDICNCSITLNNVAAEDISVPAGCTCTLNGVINSSITLASGYTPITVGDTFSSDSAVNIIADSVFVGDIILSGNLTDENCSCFLVTANSNSYIVLKDGTVNFSTLQVAIYYDNDSGIKSSAQTLKEAIDAADEDSTVTVIADCDISQRIQINKNLTITDNGNHHIIYAYNTDTSSTTYGRAIQVQGGKTLNVNGTPYGGLTFIGHSNSDNPDYNYASIFYVYSGTLKLRNNVEITDCKTTYGVVYARKDKTYTTEVKLYGCHIHNNVNTNSNGGTAVWNQADLYIYDDTVIENNCSTSSVAGAIFNDSSAVTYISGYDIYVQNNKKNCTKQENEGVANDGTASNIQISSSSSLIIDGDISGSIGIDYAGDSNGLFGKMTEASFSGKSSLKEDSGNYSTVTYDAMGNLYWHLKYSFSNLDKTDVSKYSYKLGNASVNMTSTSDPVGVSITADCGSFTVPSIPDGSTFAGIRYDNSYTTEFSKSDIYRGISVYASFDEEGAQNFIKSLTFTTPGENMEQKVTIGLYAGGSDAYFGGSFYSYCGTPASYEWAGINAASSGRYLASVSSAAENAYIRNAFLNADGWLGATLQSNMWCWTADPKESAVISSNPTSSEGYNGAYTNWAESEPVGSNCCVYLSGDSGKWKTSDGASFKGYYLESKDSCAAEISNHISVEGGVTKLNALAPSFDGDIAMYYYFSFADAIKSGKVTVKVGDGDPVNYSISDIIASEYGDYGIKVSMAAKQMNDTVEINIYDGNGKLVSSYGGEGKTNYNLRYYAQKVIKLQSNGGSDKYNESFSYDIVKFVKAMLNYGAAAQAQFGYNTANPANAGYEDGITAAPAKIDNIEDAVIKIEDSSWDVFRGAALVAESNTILRIFLRSDYTTTIDGKETEVLQTDAEYYVDIPVNAQNLSHIYSINANGENLQINAYYVINALLDSDATPNAKLTAYRLYRFGKAADSYFGVNVLSASAVEAVVNTAYAYLNKAQFIQYDQAKVATSQLSTTAPNWRRQVEVYPEDATGEVSNLHMDCSSFVWNVYCNSFGTDKVENALGIERYQIDTAKLRDVNNSTRIIQYNLVYGYNPLASEVLSILQPGDLIVKRKSGHGHVAIWVGNGYIHCTGSSYSYNDSSYTGSDKIESNGAIKYASADTFSEAWWSGFETLTILRPLYELSSSDLAPYGQARSHLGGITVSKTAYVNGKELYDGLSVNPEDTVTYKITVSNPSSKGFTCAARTVNIKDTDPSGTVHSYSYTISPNETKTFSYEYTVSGTAGQKLSGGSGTLTVAGGQGMTGADDGRGEIKFSAKSVAIENEVTQNTINSLINNATAGTKDKSGILYINELMSTVTQKSVSLADTDANLFSSLFTDASSVKRVLISDSLKPYLVSNYASGRMVINYTFNGDNDDFSTCRRVRKITTANLQTGDVVAVNVTGKTDYIYYVYLGGQDMLQVSGNVATKISDADTVLDGLLAKYSFAVLRVLGRVS